MAKPTILDVANRAGVGIASVSRVYNNTGSVSPALRARVLQAGNALGYSPNPFAQNLKAGKTNNIAYVTTSIDNMTFVDIARALNSVFAPEGYSLSIMETNYSAEKEMRLIEALVNQWVDGIVLFPSVKDTAPNAMEYFRSLGNLNKNGIRIPVVQLAKRCENPMVDCVIINEEKAAYQAAYHLIEIGRTHIAYLCAPAYSVVYEDRMKGYMRAIKEANLVPFVMEGDFSTKKGYSLMMELLQSRRRIDGVVATNDLSAAGVMLACRDYGAAIPDDIAVVGIDGSHIADLLTPQLTSVRIFRDLWGKAAAQLMLERIRNGGTYPSGTIIEHDTEILIRGSTLKSAANKYGYKE